MAILLFAAVMGFQAPAESSKMLIWEELAAIEGFVRQSLNDNPCLYYVASSDPVRGYYIEKVGVILMVPIRYRSSSADFRRESELNVGTPKSNKLILDKNEFQQRMRQWREILKKEDLLRDADFEKVIGWIKEMVPEVLTRLSRLPPEEALTLVVEEREPAWYAGLSLKKDGTRKIVTLTVDREIISKIYANKTYFSADWLNNIKRTTANRRLEALIP